MNWRITAIPDAAAAPEQPSSTERRQARVARWAALLMLGWMFLPVVTGRVYICDDLLNYHLPVRQFYAQCLQNGDAFDWMPGLFSGYFLTGSGQAGTYHPWHWLLYRWLPLETAFNLEILSSYPFMLCGMQLFLRRQLQRRDAAWLGAVVFTFSGFCTLHFLHPNAVAVVSHIPWLLLAQDVILRRRGSGRIWVIAAESGIALLTASQLLLGYPQYVWYSLLAEIVICLSCGDRSWRGWTMIGFLKVLGLALGAVQILPSMDALWESDRTDLPAEYFFQFPLTLPDLLQCIGPYLTQTRVFSVHTHDLGLYCGAVPLLLAIVAVVPFRKANPLSPLMRSMIILLAVSLWLSFGKPGGLYLVQTWLPLVGKFRRPSRIIVLMHLVTSILAAIGYLRITEICESRVFRLPRIVRWIPWFSTAAAAGVWYFQSSKAASWVLLLIGPILFLLAYQMLKDLARGKFSAAFMLFIAGDLAAYGFTYEALQNTASMRDILAALEVPPGTYDDGRIVAETQISDRPVGFEGNELLLLGWRQADGYDGLLPRTWLLNENTNLDGLRLSGVRWIIARGRHPEIHGLLATANKRWLEVPDPLPRARLTSRLQFIENPEEAVKRLSADGPTIIDNELLLSIEVQPLATGVDKMPDTAGFRTDRPGHIEIHTAASAPCLIVLAERFSSGWKATVDGRPVAVHRAELDFMGCVVPKGICVVRFLFEPDSLSNGHRISLVALIAIVVYIAARWKSIN